jgi:hypothetical protein
VAKVGDEATSTVKLRKRKIGSRRVRNARDPPNSLVTETVIRATEEDLPMNRRKIVLIAVIGVALLTAVSTMTATAGTRTHQPAHVVRAVGQEDFEPNALIFSTFRFDPGRSAPHRGDTVRLVDKDQSQGAPHTLTIVRQSEIPTTFDEVLFGCDACNRALDAHFATQPPTRRVGLSDGLNAIGDSMLIFPGQSIQAALTAPPGSTRYFLCAFHPWMQGRFDVG